MIALNIWILKIYLNSHFYAIIKRTLVLMNQQSLIGKIVIDSHYPKIVFCTFNCLTVHITSSTKSTESLITHASVSSIHKPIRTWEEGHIHRLASNSSVSTWTVRVKDHGHIGLSREQVVEYISACKSCYLTSLNLVNCSISTVLKICYSH